MKKKSFKINDKVKIKTSEEEYSGILMPSLDKNIIVLKLENGYNIGIERSKAKDITLISKYKQQKQKFSKPKHNKSLKTISILHTGGTIASEVSYETGGVTARFTPEEILLMFPELQDIANIRSRLIRNMWSEDMRFAHYNLLAKEIKQEIQKGIDGIIITHGTDTLHYTSAALAFILEDLPIPVILVGAQRSSDRGSTDAYLNLICASQFIVKTDFAEVAICMHSSTSDDKCLILPACKTRKLHTSRRDAFKPVNDKPWAAVDKKGTIHFYKTTYKKLDKRKLKLKPIKQDLKIGILKPHPNLFASELLAYKNFNGLVIELTGLGQMPLTKIDSFTKEHEKIRKAVKQLTKKMPVVAAPQTIFGRLQMNVYQPARELQEMGIIGNSSDMTTETTFIKLAWLLSNFPKKKVNKLMLENLRGELSKRLEPEEDFLLC